MNISDAYVSVVDSTSLKPYYFSATISNCACTVRSGLAIEHALSGRVDHGDSSGAVLHAEIQCILPHPAHSLYLTEAGDVNCIEQNAKDGVKTTMHAAGVSLRTGCNNPECTSQV